MPYSIFYIYAMKNEELRTQNKKKHSLFHLVAIEVRALNQIWIFLFLFSYWIPSLPFSSAPLSRTVNCSDSFPLYRRMLLFLFPIIRDFTIFISLDFVSSKRTCWTAATQTSITVRNKLRSKRAEDAPTEVKVNPVCERFSQPLENHTFFSPMDTSMLTDTYPRNVECTLKITG